MGEFVLPKVKAKYSYQRQNEDELTFGKGAIIQLTTKDDGGWYEGKYNGKVGWFPSNFVKEIKKSAADRSNSPATSQKQVVKKEDVAQSQETKREFYQQVLKNFLETEWQHVREIQNLLKIYLQPMSGQNDVLSTKDFHLLCGNLEEIYNFQNKFIQEIEECSKLPYVQQHVGQSFEKSSDKFDTLFNEYCGNHPTAVHVLQTHRDSLSKYMEGKGATSPASVFLTSNLSKPFKRLEQYPNILRELERHIQENHPDRPHLTKSISLFEKIQLVCQDTRKRKESERHILSSTIQGWEGEPLSTLGKVLYMSSAVCIIGKEERKERHLLLFPNALLMLSSSSRLSDFTYEGKLPLTALTVRKLDDCPSYQHAFEVAGNLIEKIIVITKSADEQRSWVQTLEAQCEKYRRQSLAPVASQPTPSPIVKQAPVTQIPPPPKHAMHSMSRTSPASVNQNQLSSRQLPNRQLELIHHISPTVSPPLSVGNSIDGHPTGEKPWCQMCLRPSAPSRNFSNGREHSFVERSKSPKTTKRRNKNKKEYRKHSDADETAVVERPVIDKGKTEEEQEILSVLDSYCTSHITRSTIRSAIFQGKNKTTSILEEKIIVEDPENDALIEEKSLVDTVYELRDQVKHLIQDQKKLRQNLDEETKSRRRLEAIIRRLDSLVPVNSNSTARVSPEC
uniref:Rho guanine nucleotide exchange factor 7 n=1 Tax=Phallusia mammillata TaxID=59560 RepID=A0A6F9D6X8_9ASCI|nr:rho guanine nucleotide exchange factor 7 [Phallusia mammillata]